MQTFQKRDQCSRFRRTQILSVGRHVATTLDYLPNQLVLRESHRDTVERRPPLATQIPKRMAVATLLGLKDERALPFQSGGAV
jgi:hypothetical protein